MKIVHSLLVLSVGCAMLATMLVIAPPAQSQVAETNSATRAAASSVEASAAFSWSDFNVDGRSDAFVVTPDGRGLLLESRGDGTLRDATPDSGLPERGVRFATWQDYDRDGYADLYLGSTHRVGRLFRNVGDGTFAAMDAFAGIEHVGEDRAAEWRDHDGDGYADLHVHSSHSLLLYRNRGDGTFERAELELGDPQPVVSRSVGLVGSVSVPPASSWSEDTGRELSGAAVADLARRRDSSSSPRRGRLVEGTPALDAGAAPLTAAPQVFPSSPPCPPMLGAAAASLGDVAASGTCIEASSAPTLGMLFPLSQELFVDPGGNVGMGTTTPRAHLEVVETGLGADAARFIAEDPATVRLGLEVVHGNASNALESFATAGLYRRTSTVDHGNGLQFDMNDSSGSQVNYARIVANIEDATPSAATGGLSFWTTEAGTLENSMSIAGNGDVMIGTTNAVFGAHVTVIGSNNEPGMFVRGGQADNFPMAEGGHGIIVQGGLVPGGSAQIGGDGGRFFGGFATTGSVGGNGVYAEAGSGAVGVWGYAPSGLVGVRGIGPTGVEAIGESNQGSALEAQGWDASQNGFDGGLGIQAFGGSSMNMAAADAITAVGGTSGSGPHGSGLVSSAGGPGAYGVRAIGGAAGVLAEGVIGVQARSDAGADGTAIYSEGRVGIGKSNPGFPLDVAGAIHGDKVYPEFGATADPTLRFGNGSETTGFSSPFVDTISVSTAGTERVQVDDQGAVRIGNKFFLFPNAASGPSLNVDGQAGGLNVFAGHAGGLPNHGQVNVHDAAGTAQAGMLVNGAGDGIVFGDVKNFVAENPADPQTEIWYASLEGPEAAAYVRGTARLVDGRAQVALPEHFRAVASEVSMTVQVTPRSASSKGLAVVEQSLESIVVRELFDGRGEYEFHWEVKAVRAGFEDYRVVRPRDDIQSASRAASAARSHTPRARSVSAR